MTIERGIVEYSSARTVHIGLECAIGGGVLCGVLPGERYFRNRVATTVLAVVGMTLIAI